MRWIVKLRNAKNELRYWDGEAPTEVNAVANALERYPNWWIVRAWPLNEAERQAILGPLFSEVDKPIN